MDFAGVGVADQRHGGEALAPLPARALRLALDVHCVDFFLQLGDVVADLALVEFGVRFAGATAAGAAALPALRPGELGRLAQARRHVAQPRDLDLCARGARGGVAVEDFEDDHGAVHHLAADFLFEVARLRGRDFMVDENGVDLAGVGIGGGVQRLLEGAGRGFAIDKGAHLLAFAFAQIGRGIEAGALLGEGGGDLVAQRLGQVAQLGQRGLELDVAYVRQLHGRDDGGPGLLFDFFLHAGRAALRGRSRSVPVIAMPAGMAWRGSAATGRSAVLRRQACAASTIAFKVGLGRITASTFAVSGM